MDAALTAPPVPRARPGSFPRRTETEVYLCQLGPVEEGGGHVRVLGRLRPGDEIAEVLSGWEDAHAQPDSLGWLLERAGGRLRGSREVQGAVQGGTPMIRTPQ